MKTLSVDRLRARMPLLCVALASALAGCAGMSGLGGSSQYACKAPPGVQCMSVSGTYANSLHGATAASHGATASPAPARSTTGVAEAQRVSSEPGIEPRALRSDSRMMRLWVKAWEDQDRDLVDESYVYVQVDDGRWLVEHAQARSRSAYAPVHAPAPTVRPQNDVAEKATATPPARPAAETPAQDAEQAQPGNAQPQQ